MLNQNFVKLDQFLMHKSKKVETELDRLVREGILKPVDVLEWDTPIVPIKKADNSLRLCGDYKITVNRESKLDHYPIPKVEDLFAEMAGCTTFTKLDLSHAYQQIELEEESQEYLTLNTRFVSSYQISLWGEISNWDFSTCD